MRQQVDIYETFRATWPELPHPSIVTSWRIEQRAGLPAQLEVEVRRLVDGLYMTAFQGYELTPLRQSR